MLGATEGGSTLESYGAPVFTAGYVNVSASLALSVELALLERAFRDAGHIAWKEVDSLHISGFFSCSPLAQGELYTGSTHCLLIRHTAPARVGAFRDIQLHPEKQLGTSDDTEICGKIGSKMLELCGSFEDINLSFNFKKHCL